MPLSKKDRRALEYQRGGLRDLLGYRVSEVERYRGLLEDAEKEREYAAEQLESVEKQLAATDETVQAKAEALREAAADLRREIGDMYGVPMWLEVRAEMLERNGGGIG